MKKLSPVWKAMLAAFTASTLFGFSFMFSRLVLEQVDRTILLSWRFFIAVAVMALMMLAGKLGVPGCSGFRLHPRRVKKRDWLLLLGLGLCEPVLYFIGESIGITRTNSSFAAVMIALVPLASTLFAAVFLKEKPTGKQLLCAALSVFGVVVVSMVGAGQGTVTFVGVLALLVAIIGGGGFTVLSRRLNGYSAFERTFAIFSLGLVWFFTSALLRGFGPEAIWAARRLPYFLIAVFYLGALSSVAGNCMLRCQRNIPNNN